MSLRDQVEKIYASEILWNFERLLNENMSYDGASMIMCIKLSV